MTSRDIEVEHSPHCNSRYGREIDGVVIHYTGTLTARGAINWFKFKTSKVSAHFVIDVDGAITNCVPYSKRAWHAGRGVMLTSDGIPDSDPNGFTVGIELANAGRLVVEDDRFFLKVGAKLVPYEGPAPEAATLVYDAGKRVDGWWAPYPEAQIDSLIWLLDEIAADFGVAAARNVQGHEEIATPTGRKIDPGPLFPWDRVARSAPRGTRAEIVGALSGPATDRVATALDGADGEE